MKKELKNIFIPFVMSVVFAFMLFIYEPIVTYSSNITDYWFDFKLLIVNNLKISFVQYFNLWYKIISRSFFTATSFIIPYILYKCKFFMHFSFY